MKQLITIRKQFFARSTTSRHPKNLKELE
jgi:hypothetical protein